MNIGIDLDEVICKTAQMAIDHFNIIFETDYGIDVFKKFNFKANIFSADKEVQERAVDCLLWAVSDKYMMNKVEPYTEAIKTINFLKRKGHKIYIITKRQRALQVMTSLWLREHNVNYDKLIVTDSASKAQYANKFKLDCFIDDVEENLYDMYKARKRWKKGLILFTRPWNKDCYIDTSKFIRITSWKEVLKIISIGNRLR